MFPLYKYSLPSLWIEKGCLGDFNSYVHAVVFNHTEDKGSVG